MVKSPFSICPIHSFLSSTRLVDKLQNFIQFPLLFNFRTSHYGCSYAMLKVPLQNLFFHSGNGTFDGVNLVQNVDTIFTILDHPLDPSDLPFDSLQRNNIILMVRILCHFFVPFFALGVYTPWGYIMFEKYSTISI